MRYDPYRRVAPWYDIVIEPFNRALWPIGFNFFQASEGMQVLEVGCGTGNQLAYYRNRGCLIAGIDLSAAMLRVARNRLGGNVFVCQGDASALPWASQTFDLVLATFVLHEIPPRPRLMVLAEIERVLRYEGRLGFVDYHPEPWGSLKGLMVSCFNWVVERAAGRDHYSHYRHFLKTGGVPSMINQFNLRIEDSKRVSGGNIGLYRLSRI